MSRWSWMFLIGGAIGLSCLSACSSTARVVRVPRHEAKAIPAAEVSPTSDLPPEAAVPSSEKTLEIISEPAGARVLVNNQPVGRTPLRLAVKSTPQGFFADYVTVKVRFVAEETGQASQTIEETFSPREKLPVALTFTPKGAQRKLQ